MKQTAKSNSVKMLEEKFPTFANALLDKPYVSSTNDIHITVWPEYLDSKSSVIGDLFIWAYHIRIDNKSLENIKLVNRYWRITDEKGIVQEVNGEGVVGEKPLISPNSFFEYSSGVHLRYPSGIMSGHYQMQKTNGEVFDLTIPTFSLDVPNIKAVVN